MSDVYVVIHVSTTCDEHGIYVTKDSAEIIELAWIVVDAKTLDEIHGESILVRPINTPITPLCTSLSTITWEHVRTAGTFKDAITKFDQFIHDFIISKNLDFTFVSLNVKDLRVQIPREARDKSVVLPPYLQHSRVFDLRQEYSKWQAHHPESLSYSASSLSNICTALEVEPITTSQQQQLQLQNQIQRSNSLTSQNSLIANPTANINKNLPFHLQQSSGNQPIQPKRAMEETILLSRVLKNLIKKSIPIDDHPDVLTKPYDARADVRAFLTERSKILYMSNLPHDTTQSELESWFTQYGGRPIAFWTLKTSDQHKPTGSGFAVFSSHEEATESLAMNGRALNDKAIEVQPSSARVLDRAQDILTPFPPSKNRPRPGDWTCPSCGFSNFQRRTACFRCSFPAASAAAIQESMYSNHNYNNNNHSSNYNSSNLNNNNHNNNNSNSINSNNNSSNNNSNNNGQLFNHNLSNNNGSNMASQPPSSTINNSQSQQSNTNNGSGVSSVPFRAGDWKCGNDNCSYHNFAKNICCLRCGAPRVQNTLINGHHHHHHHHHNSHHNSHNHSNGHNHTNNRSGNHLHNNNNNHTLQHPHNFHQQQLQQFVQQQNLHTGSHDSLNQFTPGPMQQNTTQIPQQQLVSQQHLNSLSGLSQQQYYQHSNNTQQLQNQTPHNIHHNHSHSQYQNFRTEVNSHNLPNTNKNVYDDQAFKSITGQINSLSLNNSNPQNDSNSNTVYYNGLNSIVNSSTTSLNNSIGNLTSSQQQLNHQLLSSNTFNSNPSTPGLGPIGSNSLYQQQSILLSKTDSNASGLPNDIRLNDDKLVMIKK